MGHSVDDCALLMAASVSPHAMDPLSWPADAQSFFPLPDLDLSTRRIGCTEAFVAAFADTFRSAPETLGPNVRANVELAAAITLADRAWAHLQQTRIARELARAFERFDLIVAPATPVTPFPWTELFADRIGGQAMKNYYHWLALTYIVTLATNPALSLPCGRDDHGMPFGLQLIGPL